MNDDITPELQLDYYTAFMSTEGGRRVAADMRHSIYGLEVTDSTSAISKVSLISFFEGIMKNCGVTDEAMMTAFEIVVAKSQVKPEPEEETMYNE